MYVHDPPQASVSLSSAAQTVHENLGVRAPGFRLSAFPLLGATLRAQAHPFLFGVHILWTDHTKGMYLPLFMNPDFT
jgi:hypothetical protein